MRTNTPLQPTFSLIHHPPRPLRLCHYPCLFAPSKRAYSTPPTTPLLKSHTLPAPHLGQIQILTLSSPQNKNAISRQLLSELSSHIQTIRSLWPSEDTRNARGDVVDRNGRGDKTLHLQDGGKEERSAVGEGVRCLVLGSDIDGVFCAGADLKERKTMSPTETQAFLRDLRGTFSSLATLPIPTISAVSGFALGGGLELALSTTFRVFASTATVGLPETRLGIIPGAGGTYRLRELVGRAKAAEMILTGRRVGGREGKELGVCERLVVGEGEEDGREVGVKMQGREERERTIEAAVRMAVEICEGGPVAVGAALRAVGRGVGREFGGEEDRAYEMVVRTRDRDEALRAFGEKRKARFTGR